MCYLFESLHLRHIISLFSAVLLEEKVLLLSKRSSLLTYVTETLVTLMWPFTWQHVYGLRLIIHCIVLCCVVCVLCFIVKVVLCCLYFSRIDKALQLHPNTSGFATSVHDVAYPLHHRRSSLQF